MTFLSTKPKNADSDNNLLAKIVQVVAFNESVDVKPESADSDNNLLAKIALALGATPKPADSDNNLLAKILRTL